MDKRQKILIVDDSEFNRDMLKEILGETYNYLEAENGNVMYWDHVTVRVENISCILKQQQN